MTSPLNIIQEAEKIRNDGKKETHQETHSPLNLIQQAEQIRVSNAKPKNKGIHEYVPSITQATKKAAKGAGYAGRSALKGFGELADLIKLPVWGIEAATRGTASHLPKIIPDRLVPQNLKEKIQEWGDQPSYTSGSIADRALGTFDELTNERFKPTSLKGKLAQDLTAALVGSKGLNLAGKSFTQAANTPELVRKIGRGLESAGELKKANVAGTLAGVGTHTTLSHDNPDNHISNFALSLLAGGAGALSTAQYDAFKKLLQNNPEFKKALNELNTNNIVEPIKNMAKGALGSRERAALKYAPLRQKVLDFTNNLSGIGNLPRHEAAELAAHIVEGSKNFKASSDDVIREMYSQLHASHNLLENKTPIYGLMKEALEPILKFGNFDVINSKFGGIFGKEAKKWHNTGKNIGASNKFKLNRPIADASDTASPNEILEMLALTGEKEGVLRFMKRNDIDLNELTPLTRKILKSENFDPAHYFHLEGKPDAHHMTVHDLWESRKHLDRAAGEAAFHQVGGDRSEIVRLRDLIDNTLEDHFRKQGEDVYKIWKDVNAKYAAHMREKAPFFEKISRNEGQHAKILNIPLNDAKAAGQHLEYIMEGANPDARRKIAEHLMGQLAENKTGERDLMTLVNSFGQLPQKSQKLLMSHLPKETSKNIEMGLTSIKGLNHIIKESGTLADRMFTANTLSLPMHLLKSGVRSVASVGLGRPKKQKKLIEIMYEEGKKGPTKKSIEPGDADTLASLLKEKASHGKSFFGQKMDKLSGMDKSPVSGLVREISKRGRPEMIVTSQQEED